MLTLLQLLMHWKRSIWTLIDFLHGIKTSQLRERFLKFIQHDAKKQPYTTTPAMTGTHSSRSSTCQHLPVFVTWLTCLWLSSYFSCSGGTVVHTNALAPVHSGLSFATPASSKTPVPSSIGIAQSKLSFASSNVSGSVKDKRAHEREREKYKLCNNVMFFLEACR